MESRVIDVKNLPTISPSLLAVPLLPTDWVCKSDSQLISMFDPGMISAILDTEPEEEAEGDVVVEEIQASQARMQQMEEEVDELFVQASQVLEEKEKEIQANLLQDMESEVDELLLQASQQMEESLESPLPSATTASQGAVKLSRFAAPVSSSKVLQVRK